MIAWPAFSTVAATASAYAAKKQAEAARAARFAQARLDLIAPTVKPTPAKCACCGSHEFRKHAGRMICAYCRTDVRK